MNKINLLFITKDRSQQLERNSFYLADELSKHTNLIIWKTDGSIQNILAKIPFKPDFILINDYHPHYSPSITDLNTVSIPKGIMMHDLHYKKPQRRKFIKSADVQVIFSHYRDTFLQWYPKLAPKMVWFPHFIHPEIFKDYYQPRTINYLMMGANPPSIYPIRNKFINQLKKERGFVFHQHPGYQPTDLLKKGVIAGENYAMEINRAKIFFTCDSIFKYPLLKYFEVLACNTLLIAKPSKELRDLGFIDGKTFIASNPSNVIKKARFFQKNEKLRKLIAYNGYQMVMKRHTTQVRVGELLKKIREII